MTEPRHLTVADLQPNDCRFPFGNGPYTFCGHPKTQGSYCAEHSMLCSGFGTYSERAADKEPA